MCIRDRVHVTQQAVYKYETGIVTNIPLDKLESIDACLGVAPGYLAGWQGSPAGDVYKRQDMGYCIRGNFNHGSIYADRRAGQRHFVELSVARCV